MNEYKWVQPDTAPVTFTYVDPYTGKKHTVPLTWDQDGVAVVTPEPGTSFYADGKVKL
jgi:hypothetical protein